MKKRVKNNTIAIIITGLSFGGAERVTSYLANYFTSKGRNVHLISLTTGEHAYSLSEKIQVTEFNISSDLPPLRRYSILISQIRKTIKQIRPSVVLGMMSFSGGLASLACWGLGVPFLISERNDPYTTEAFSSFEKKVLHFLYNHFVTKAVFQSHGAASYYYHPDDPRSIIIPNPLFLETMPSPKLSEKQSRRIVSAGRLNFQKNFTLLITAFAKVHEKYPEYQLIIFGEGEQRSQLENVCTALHLGAAVALPGIEKDIFSKLAEAEMFVLSSNFEGMPNALLEAMAMRLPCITTDYSEGRGTIIDSGKNGIVVPRNDSDALFDAMIFLIENPQIAQSYGNEALKIREELDSERICMKWLDVIENVEMHYYKC